MDNKKLVKIIDESMNAKGVDVCFQKLSPETEEFLNVCYADSDERKFKVSRELVDRQLWAEEEPSDIAINYNNLFELIRAIRTHLVKEIKEEENRMKKRSA